MIWCRKKAGELEGHTWTEEWFCTFEWNCSPIEWIFGIVRYDGIPYARVQNWLFTFKFGKSGYWD